MNTHFNGIRYIDARAQQRLVQANGRICMTCAEVAENIKKPMKIMESLAICVLGILEADEYW